MTVRRFKDSGWQADFYAGTERIRKVFPTKKEAKDYESKIKTEIRENRYWNIQREEFDTFSEMLDWYLDLPQSKRKKSHQNDVRRAEYLRDFFGKLSPVRITPEKVEEYIDKRLNTKNRRKRFNKPATVNRELSLFSRVFNLAYRNGKTHYNPAKSVQKLKGEESRDRVLTDEEWEAYHKAAPAWYKPIALCAYVTAMREGEILNLKWKRVNRKTGFIRLKPEDTKTSEGRPIPIDPRLDEVLSALPRSFRNRELVFTRYGEPVKYIQWVHKQTCKKAKIEDFWFHDFRHTCITNWRRKGVDFITIMKATGHKTLSMFHRYNAVGDDDLRALVSEKKVDGQNMVNSKN